MAGDWFGSACWRGAQRARGAGVVAADLSAGELVEQLLAGFVQGLELEHFAAEVAEFGEPVAGIEREQRVDLLAQPWASAGLWPAVEMAICRSPRRTTEGK